MLSKNQELNNSKSKNKALIGPLLLIISIGIFVFFTQGLISDVNAISSNIESSKSELETVNAEIEEYEVMEETYDLTTQVKRDQILKSITEDLDQDEVIRDFIEITDEYDISLNSLSFSKGSTSFDGVNTLRISTSLEGNYADLSTFLKGLELNQRLFDVQSISVYITELEILDIERATFSLTINAYYLD